MRENEDRKKKGPQRIQTVMWLMECIVIKSNFS